MDLSDEDKRKLKEHDFSILFDRIPESIKESAALLLSEESGEQYSKVEIRRKLRKDYRDSFLKWRYIHESGTGGSIDIQFVKKLFRALVKAAVSQQNA